MKKHILKNERGITLIVLIITIVVLAILIGVAVKNINIGTDIKQYNYMCADIELIESKIMSYYNDKGRLPTQGEAFNAKSVLGTQASSRDNDNYYQIDLRKLTNVTLNYGGGNIEDINNLQGNEDVYIINEQSHKVYYLKGVKFENTIYYAAKPVAGDTGEPHTHTLELVTATEATCTTTGNIEYYVCSGCNKYFEDSEGTVEITDKSSVVIAATGTHSYGEYTVTTEATCTTTGTKTAICTQCGGTKTQTIAATGHTYGEYTVTTEATCTTTGTKTATCTKCGATKTQTIAATGHTYGAWVITKEATETEDGLQTRTCEKCGNEETKIILHIQISQFISFKIDSTLCQAEKGMTWEEWVNSKYNIMGATITGTRVYIVVGINNKYITGVTATDTITAGGTYTLTTDSGSIM